MIFFHFYLRRLWLVKLSSFRRRCLPRINVFCFARDMISCVARSCVHVAGCWPKLMTFNLRRPSQLWWVLQRCYSLLDLDLLDKSMSVMSEQIFHLQMYVYKRVYWFFLKFFLPPTYMLIIQYYFSALILYLNSKSIDQYHHPILSRVSKRLLLSPFVRVFVCLQEPCAKACIVSIHTIINHCLSWFCCNMLSWSEFRSQRFAAPSAIIPPTYQLSTAAAQLFS